MDSTDTPQARPNANPLALTIGAVRHHKTQTPSDDLDNGETYDVMEAIHRGIIEIRMAREGKIKLKTWDDLMRELDEV